MHYGEPKNIEGDGARSAPNKKSGVVLEIRVFPPYLFRRGKWIHVLEFCPIPDPGKTFAHSARPRKILNYLAEYLPEGF